MAGLLLVSLDKYYLSVHSHEKNLNGTDFPLSEFTCYEGGIFRNTIESADYIDDRFKYFCKLQSNKVG